MLYELAFRRIWSLCRFTQGILEKQKKIEIKQWILFERGIDILSDFASGNVSYCLVCWSKTTIEM
jgi:hypothetical protein